METIEIIAGVGAFTLIIISLNIYSILRVLNETLEEVKSGFTMVESDMSELKPDNDMEDFTV